MKTTDFTLQPEVVQILANLKKDKIHERQFSDVLDENNNQYVELVQEGGGVLGVALVGYTYILEQMGLRFFSLAGTSAGSINAMMLAGMGSASLQKSEKIIDALVNKNLYDFVDGDSDSRDFIEALVEKAKRIKLIWKGWQVIDEIYDDLGLNPGDDFLNWLTGILNANNIRTVSDLNNQFGKRPGNLKIRDGINKNLDGLEPRLALITADLTTETKVEFPRMASLYFPNPDQVNPALFVRASMSIPYFFSPVVLDKIPAGGTAKKNWEDLAGFIGDVPKEAKFVDGGIMSNFPIDVFHKKNTVPRLPTFGVRLGIDRNSANEVSNPLNLFGAMFNSLRHLHDYDFILRNPDYKLLISMIDIGKHDWLNFAIKDDAKQDLFVRGARAANDFLRTFDWIKYKKVREETKVYVAPV